MHYFSKIINILNWLKYVWVLPNFRVLILQKKSQIFLIQQFFFEFGHFNDFEMM